MVDVRQVFEAWRAADSDFRHSYRGPARSRRVNGKDYLYRISGKVLIYQIRRVTAGLLLDGRQSGPDSLLSASEA